MLYMSGSVGLVPSVRAASVCCGCESAHDLTCTAQTMKLAGDGVEEQAEQVMRNMEAILAAAGCTFDDVVKTTVLCARRPACNRRWLTTRRHRLTDIKDFAAVNQIYGRRFPSNPPVCCAGWELTFSTKHRASQARSTFAVSALPLGAKVEIEAIAALR